MNSLRGNSESWIEWPDSSDWTLDYGYLEDFGFHLGGVEHLDDLRVSPSTQDDHTSEPIGRGQNHFRIASMSADEPWPLLWDDWDAAKLQDAQRTTSSTAGIPNNQSISQTHTTKPPRDTNESCPNECQFMTALKDPTDPPSAERASLHKQDARWESDLYTARWIRGDGTDRAGWCAFCSTWYKLKDSAYVSWVSHSPSRSSS